MDATQQIEDSFFGEEDDSDSEHDQAEGKSEREPLAVLKVFKNNHIAETEVPLYQGENVLGRDPTSCSVPLQARSVSGHHAIISITVFGPNDHRAHSEATEALLWDLGSLNGTRKGLSKLTPHVRYALTDGDGVVLADLPCQYVSLKNTEKNTHTSTGEKARGQMSSNSSTEVETVKGVENIAKVSTLPPVPVWSNEVKTPQLQMTPKQPETTLVPESDSDSDGEKHRQRERRRIVASDSGTSDLSSPTCSTFLTPATKIIPESEDESSITPSPALKGKFQKAGNDTEVSSGSSKPDPLHFNIDSDTDVEDDDAEMSKATHGTAAVVPAETVAVNPADLYMNSDTDAEEEEIGKVKSDPEASGLAPAKSDLVNPAALNMDSDTDVEEDKPVKTDVVSSSGPAAVLEEKKDAASSAKFHLESDTDVEEEEEVCHIQDIRSLSSLVAEFNMNSDTDVEEEEQTTKALVQPCETDNYVPDAKMLPPESDNDTDVEEDDVTDIRTPTVARETGNSETAGECSTGTPHDSPVGAQPPAEALRDEIRLDSDTDVEEDEDEMDEKEQKCAEAAIQIVHSSTPRGAGLPEEEKETQAFLSPSQLFKRPGLPSLLHPSVSPGGASHTDDDLAVAETQSFMGDAAQANATLDKTPQLLDEYQRSGGAPSFQRDFSDSSPNQMTEAEELNREPAEEDWQLQATQLYEGGTKSGPTPLDLDATQAFTDSIIQEDEEDGRKEKEEEETQLLAAPNHSSIHSETQLIKPGAQNINPSDSDEKVGAGEPQRKAEEDVHDEMQADSHLSTADTLLIIRSPRQEEQTQPYAFLAEKIQEETEKEEHESKDEAIQQGGEGQRAQNGMMGHENNDERQTKEHEPVVIEAKNDVTRDAAEDEKKKGTEDEREESENKVDEARTQPAEDDAIIATQPICKAKDEEEHEEEQLNEPSSSKGTWTAQGESAQCIKAKHHTHDAVAIAETLPMCEEEQEEEKNKFKNSRRPGRRRQPAETVEPKRSVESGNVTHLTIAETLPLCEEDSERQEEQSEAMSTKRSSIRRQNVMSHVTIPETLPLCDEEEGREEEPQNEAKSVRKSRRGKQTAKVEAAQPPDADFTAETLKPEEKEEEPDCRKSLRGSAASVRARGRGRVAVEKDKKGKTEKDENCEQEVDGGNKGRGRKNLRQKSKNDDKARLELVGAENEELERLKKQEDEEEIQRLQETRDQLEREKSMRLEKEREEQEKREQEENDRLERERIDHEKKAREEKEQIEREMKEREEKEKFEREKHLEKGRREREEKEKQEEKDRLAREKREREEKEMRKEKEKQEKEMELREKEIKGHEDSVEKEHRQAPGRRKTVRKGGKNKKEEEQDKDEGTKESRESEQELSEKRKKECEDGSSKKPEEELAASDAKPRRGRRTARKSVAPPAAVEDEGGPAKRTRSRSNSSNSVCSEQSTQASLNEGRRRGRRTTTVIPSEKADTKQAAHSRSNSISSERSSGSVATQSRGRGATRRKSVKVEEPEEEKEEKRKRSTALGRGRGRGGKRSGANELKAEAAGEAEKEEAEISAIAAGNSVMSQSSSRGRKRGADISRAETPQPISKTPRRSIAGPTHKVLFTGVADEDGEKVVVRLGGALAKGSSDMTHLVTDKVRRTVKFLCAVARGVPIVTPDWLSKCGKAGSFLSPNGFLVKDVEQEKRFNFSLQDALRVASSQPLLQGYEIHVTPSVKPEPAQMKEIITCCGARFLPKMPSAHKAQVVVVSCEEDRALCERAQSLSFPVVSAEFLLTGILQQKVDLQTHALSLSTAASVPKPNARRRGK